MVTYIFKFYAHFNMMAREVITDDMAANFVIMPTMPVARKGHRWMNPKSSLITLDSWATAMHEAQRHGTWTTMGDQVIIHYDIYEGKEMKNEKIPNHPTATIIITPPSSWTAFWARTKTYGKPEWLFICAVLAYIAISTCVIVLPDLFSTYTFSYYAVGHVFATMCLFSIPYIIHVFGFVSKALDRNETVMSIRWLFPNSGKSYGDIRALCEKHNYDTKAVLREMVSH